MQTGKIKASCIGGRFVPFRWPHEVALSRASSAIIAAALATEFDVAILSTILIALVLALNWSATSAQTIIPPKPVPHAGQKPSGAKTERCKARASAYVQTYGVAGPKYSGGTPPPKNYDERIYASALDNCMNID